MKRLHLPKYLTQHARFDWNDFDNLQGKGYTYPEIAKIWDRDTERDGILDAPGFNQLLKG